MSVLVQSQPAQMGAELRWVTKNCILLVQIVSEARSLCVGCTPFFKSGVSSISQDADESEAHHWEG